ncbi:hypothetical protein SSTU70S_00174 [Stutzerimonas stutzeri]
MTPLATPASHIEAVLSLANASHLLGDRDPIIARSWRRCVHDYGLDPARPAERASCRARCCANTRTTPMS